MNAWGLLLLFVAAILLTTAVNGRYAHVTTFLQSLVNGIQNPLPTSASQGFR